jgi:hypothetical protein
MTFLLALGAIPLLLICAAGVVEAIARRRHWPAFDERPVRYDPRRPSGKGW